MAVERGHHQAERLGGAEAQRRQPQRAGDPVAAVLPTTAVDVDARRPEDRDVAARGAVGDAEARRRARRRRCRGWTGSGRAPAAPARWGWCRPPPQDRTVSGRDPSGSVLAWSHDDMPRTPPDGHRRPGSRPSRAPRPSTCWGPSPGCGRRSAGRPGGLDAAGLAATLGPSRLTLGGLLLHLAMVEDYMFTTKLRGEQLVEPWRSMGHDGSDEWEFTVRGRLHARGALRAPRTAPSSGAGPVRGGAGERRAGLRGHVDDDDGNHAIAAAAALRPHRGVRPAHRPRGPAPRVGRRASPARTRRTTGRAEPRASDGTGQAGAGSRCSASTSGRELGLLARPRRARARACSSWIGRARSYSARPGRGELGVDAAPVVGAEHAREQRRGPRAG